MRRKITIFTVVSILWIVFGLLCIGDLRAQDKRLGLRTVVIDAGHGGKDPGGVSRDKSTYEKNLVLDIAKRFGSKIKATCPFFLPPLINFGFSSSSLALSFLPIALRSVSA